MVIDPSPPYNVCAVEFSTRRISVGVTEVKSMPLWLASVLFLAAVGGILLCRKYLSRNRTVRTLCMAGCVLMALILAAYIGLTLLFVDAVQHQPPAP